MAGWYRDITSKKKDPLFYLMLLLIIVLASCQSSESKIEELTKEFLIGTWVYVDMEQNGPPDYFHFTDDEDYFTAESLSNLDVSPGSTGTYILEGPNLTIEFDDNSPTCAGGFWNFQLELTQSGYLIFDTISYKCPEGRTHVVPWIFSRVSN
jgi:hypothetical protein